MDKAEKLKRKQYCILHCKISPEEYESTTFHRFPKNERIRCFWIKAIGKTNWKPYSSARLCSNHFESKYYDSRPGMSPSLRLNVIPTIFNGKISRKHRRLVKEFKSVAIEETTLPNVTSTHCKKAEINVQSNIILPPIDTEQLKTLSLPDQVSLAIKNFTANTCIDLPNKETHSNAVDKLSGCSNYKANTSMRTTPKQICVMGCKISADEKSNVSLHRFPETEPMREIWIKACNKKNWTPTITSSLCIKHFETKYVNKQPNSNPYLRPQAIPTIFSKKQCDSVKTKPIVEQNTEMLPKNPSINTHDENDKTMILHDTNKDKKSLTEPSNFVANICKEEPLEVELGDYIVSTASSDYIGNDEDNSLIGDEEPLEGELNELDAVRCSTDLMDSTNSDEVNSHILNEEPFEEELSDDADPFPNDGHNIESQMILRNLEVSPENFGIAKLLNQSYSSDESSMSPTNGIISSNDTDYKKKYLFERKRVLSLQKLGREMYRETKTLRQRVSRQEKRLNDLKLQLYELTGNKK